MSMPEKAIADLFHVRNRFLRSAHLERDFQDPAALSSYVMTDFARSCIGRMANGLKPRSGSRAWRMTGDYGCGKSSFALLLAHWFAGHSSTFPSDLRKAVDPQQFGVARPHFLPVLVTCSRQSLGLSILRSLHSALNQVQGRGAKSKVATELQRLSESQHEPTDDQVFRLISEVNSRIISESKAKGLLLILDELGKFLEFAALHPDRQDVFLLQRLAEAASRSADEPLFVISLLHQGFNAYADHLNQSAQREWEKVAGRFEEIVFSPPFEQAASIISSAINVRVQEVPKVQTSQLKWAMERTLSLGWLGCVPAKAMVDAAPQLYPLHPTVLPVLIRTFRRFGQNERSLFSFLLSNEPFGLQAFAQRAVCDDELYCLHHFYDYVRTNFGHRLSAQSYRSHWNLIDSVIESFVEENEVQLKVLKTVGILNLLNDSDLLATEDSVLCALCGDDKAQEKNVRAALSALHKYKRIIYDRGRARGLCLWPHSSVDLEKAYEDACRVIDTPQHVAGLIKDFLETRPIVARRHYIETGNLRHAEVRYCAVKDLPTVLEGDISDADGLIIVPLCETLSERETALAFAKQGEMGSHANWLVAVPQPLNNLAALVQEVQRWEWVSVNTLELNADKYAREEVSRQKAAAQSQLEKRVQHFIGWQQLSGHMMLDWFCEGRALKVKNGRHLLETLSQIFEDTYHLAPRIQNELVNRRNLSSAAAAARMRLIGRMFSAPGAPFLGMDPAKKPPEMSMYLSVLKRTGLHRMNGDSWHIGEPHHRSDVCNVLPALRRIAEIVREKPDARVNVAALFSELRTSPYGVRDGIIPLLLSVFAVSHDRDLAFYKDGSFLRELNGEQMLILTKAPERFDIQFCKIEGVRAELFARLLAVLEIHRPGDREIELLDLVKNLCVFVAQLPAYARNTKRLTPEALAVRQAILEAREPAKLLFNDLPTACGFAPIEAGPAPGKPVKNFVRTLKVTLEELRIAFPELQDRLRKGLQENFNLSGSFQECRSALINRSQRICLTVTEPKFKAFCLRLMDDTLTEADWLESVGSHLALKPPSKWHDADEDFFDTELAHVAALFHRVESVVFNGQKGTKNELAIRLAVTLATGVEHQQVIHFNADEEHLMNDLQGRFAEILAGNERLGLAAASRAIWASFESAGKRKND
jgi:hypothetical protein